MELISQQVTVFAELVRNGPSHGFAEPVILLLFFLLFILPGSIKLSSRCRVLSSGFRVRTVDGGNLAPLKAPKLL